MLVKASQLKLADKVQLFDGGYGTATVQQITEDTVTLVRPYIQTADFSCTVGVITYIGLEDVKLYIGDTREVELLESKTLK
jgi:hypothetical protein